MKHHRPAAAVAQLGFRSKLEMQVNQQLIDAGLAFSYEGRMNVIKYTHPVTHHRYLADFLLANGILIETKGLFTAQDRKKHLYIKEQHPILDIRFVFMNSKNRLSKTSKTTYAAWAEAHGFKWAEKLIPNEWITEERDLKEFNAIKLLLWSMNQ